MAPTPDEALRALAIMDQRRLVPRKTAAGWIVENADAEGQRRRVRVAGVHPEAHIALIAADDAFATADTRKRTERALAALDALQTASYRPRQRDVPNPDPVTGGTVRLWDIVRAAGGATSVLGRPSLLKALEDAAEAERAGTL